MLLIELNEFRPAAKYRWTGKHNQNGDLFANFEIGRERFSNHEVSGWLEQSASGFR